MRLSVKQIEFFMRNVRTRMPFRYGVATLTSVPILHVAMGAELEDGRRARGVAADILPPKWFDKEPAKTYQDNVEDLLFSARAAAKAYAQAGSTPKTVFALWHQGYAATLQEGDGRGLNHLTAGHGSTLMERALIDALGKAMGLSYHQLLKENLLGLDFARIHPELEGMAPAQAIAPQPLRRMYVRHTVGLADPILTADISPQEQLDDGLPQSLEEYVDRQRLRYFKVKVSGQLESDLERLAAIASLLDRLERPYFATLDGNEQYRDVESFLELLQRLKEKRLERFYRSILYIEQPLERGLALDPRLAQGIPRISAEKPMLIDESDGDLETFKQALTLGYLGVSSKNCKGLIKALANQALVRKLNGGRYFLTGEDLMNLPVVPLHQDLAHLAALGIEHAERNGHHYVRGLDHLSPKERQECRKVHPGLYHSEGDFMYLDVREGRLDISSLHAPGLGVGLDTDVESMMPLDQWEFASLE
jgi:hypothetical protein